MLYLAAGLLWNLKYDKEKGVVFAFMRQDWLEQQAETGFAKIFFYALPFMLIASVAILSFVW